MCGRFTQYFTWAELHDLYEITGPARNLAPRYNIPPTATINVIVPEGEGLALKPMRWGLIPALRKNPKPPGFTFNARADKVETAWTWKEPFAKRRCIIPMSGFYEWRREGKEKTPFHITMADKGIMPVAGIWERGKLKGEDVDTVALITTDANATMQPIHDRMPVIVDDDDRDAWLSGRAGTEILLPCYDDWIEPREVSSYVNKVANQGPECVEGVA